MAFQRILVAVDGSAVAERAAEVAFELARSLGAALALIQVVDPEKLPDGAEIWVAHDDRQLLNDLARRSALSPAPATFVPIGRPADEILRAAQDWQADLIIVGSHGRGRIARALIGSVAEAVLHRARCEVLVVRGGA